MNKQKNINQPLNPKINKFKEISKDNKSLGSTTYSKNKKQLDQMLREYQSFCKKYFGESTPIGSMTEERMNKLLEDQDNNTNLIKNCIQNDNFNDQFSDILKENDEIYEDELFFLGNKNILDYIPNDFPYSEIDRLGNHKNTKNDYNRRSNLLFKTKEKKENKEDEKKEEKEIKEKKEDIINDDNKKDEEYDDFEHDENIEEIKNKKAILIQKIYRNKKIKNKEKLYFGYDNSKNNALWIFANKFDSKDNIKSIIIKCFNINKKKEFTFNQTIKDLLNVDFISKEEIKKNMSKIIDKIGGVLEKNEINKNDEKINNEINNKKEINKGLEDEDEEYTF